MCNPSREFRNAQSASTIAQRAPNYLESIISTNAHQSTISKPRPTAVQSAISNAQSATNDPQSAINDPRRHSPQAVIRG
eukprot:6568597-Alexandrium_andersonii.AAC.1